MQASEAVPSILITVIEQQVLMIPPVGQPIGLVSHSISQYLPTVSFCRSFFHIYGVVTDDNRGIYRDLHYLYQNLLKSHQSTLIKVEQQYCFYERPGLCPTFMFWKTIVGVTANQFEAHRQAYVVLYVYQVIFRLGQLTLC
mgnify:CR=1 FL=1